MMWQERMACLPNGSEPEEACPWRHEDRWQGTREPRLDDLLDDPIMTLLWRYDGLDPAVARAKVQALQELLRNAR